MIGGRELLMVVPGKCPECAKNLEQHPVMWYWSCVLHGDYVPLEGSWVWNPAALTKAPMD